jgi:DNA-directed RNA polymerase subunit RPC12/RpoP
MSKLTVEQAALAAYLHLPTGLVETITEGFPPPKSGAKKPPFGGQKKQIKEFPFGGDQAEKPGQGGSMSGLAGATSGQQPIMGDQAAQHMQQQQVDKERAEMVQAQQRNAEDEKERKHLKQLRIKAEKAVSDDLNDKYADKDDQVEFYPRMESFTAFASGSRLSESDERIAYVCLECGKKWRSAHPSPGACPKCHGSDIELSEETVDGHYISHSTACDSQDGGKCTCGARARFDKEQKAKRPLKEVVVHPEDDDRITCPHCHRKFKGFRGTTMQWCPHCKQDVVESVKSFSGYVTEAYASKWTEEQLYKIWKFCDKYKNEDKKEYALRCYEIIKSNGPEGFQRAGDLGYAKEPKGLGYMAKQAVRSDMREIVSKVLKEEIDDKGDYYGDAKKQSQTYKCSACGAEINRIQALTHAERLCKACARKHAMPRLKEDATGEPSTEASTMGFPPGRWPAECQYKGCRFVFFRFKRDDDGDIQWGEYHNAGAFKDCGRVLTIYND